VSESWHFLVDESTFPEGGKLAAQVGGWHVLVGQTDDGLFAVNDRCTHQAALLSAGKIRRGVVMCPLHGARFELETGRCVGAAYRDLRTFAVRVEGGRIEVCVPDAPPGFDEAPVIPDAPPA
jgi:anthranilate 1,2-dioxygenase ferredoxin component